MTGGKIAARFFIPVRKFCDDLNHGSVGYPALSQASKPPLIGFAFEKPFCSIRNAARALVFSAGQVQ